MSSDASPPSNSSPDAALANGGGGLVRTVLGWPRRLYDWTLHWADTRHAALALFILAFTESSFFPVPPDVLLIAMCLGVQRRSFHFAALCTVGSVAGGVFGYAIGAGFWAALSPFFYEYVPGFSPESFARVQATYLEYGVWVVFTAGFTPIPYKLFTIASGVMDMPIVPFIIASLVGRAGRFFLVAALIYYFGKPVKAFIDRYFNLLATVFTVLLIGGFAAIKWFL